MATITYTPSLAEKYILPLINLSDNIKLEIINRLSASMLNKTKKEDKADWADTFYGCWTDERSAEEMIEDIRNSRVPNRDIADLFD